LAEGLKREPDNRITVLALVLAWAVDRGHLTANPLATWKRVYDPDRADVLWSDHDIARFLDAAYPELRRAMALALCTAQRREDLLTFKWSQYTNGVLRLRQGKTKQPITVRAPAPLKALLDGLYAEGGATSDFVLANRSGRQWNPDYFHHQWKKTCRAAGLPDDLHFHDLRGTAVVRMAESGCTHLEIATVSGHSLKAVAEILKRYWTGTELQAANAMAKYEPYLARVFANGLQTVNRFLRPDEITRH
jgi:integrase